MLTHLTIENFAIIDRIDVRFGPGLVALTGETGAGKSIVIDAVSALLGSRLGPDVIRSGAAQAHVEGVFFPPPLSDLAVTLEDLGIPSDDETLILAREVGRGGRSIARVNGRAVPLSALQRIGRLLVDLHGQGEHLALLRVPEHLRLLDGFAGLGARRDDVKHLAGRVNAIRAEYELYSRDQREIARRVDLLRFQVDEIASARLDPGEEDALRQERAIVANAEKLANGIEEIRELLSDGERGPALEAMGRATTVLADLARIDSALAEYQQALDLAIDQVTELGRGLRRYRDLIEHDPARLEEIEERLTLIRNLQRKYGSTIADVLDFAQRAKSELDQLEHREERLDELKEQEAACLGEYAEVAGELSRARLEAAKRLVVAIERELGELNMVGARFDVRISQTPTPDGVPLPDGRTVAFGQTGIDDVEFFIATNPGEELKPLVRVVSGGETARLMLALKTILAQADAVPTLIFDEVDAGLGGQTAVVVGRKIARLARDRQVICVTHLSQIAAFADIHVAVRKQTVDGRARTDARLLDSEERVHELAGMIGGEAGLASARAHARDALETSLSWKSQQDLAVRGTR